MKTKLLALVRLPGVTRILLTLFLALVICVVFIGLDSVTGIILGWLAVTALILLMVRRWRKAWYFLILLFASFVGAILLSGLYMVVALPIAEWLGGAEATESIAWRIFHVIISNIILLVSPVGIFIGIMGAIVLVVSRLVGLWRKKSVSSGT
jgi:hypothetical protein